MANAAGRDFRVQVFISGVWEFIPGERSTSAKVNNEQVDVTEKGAVPWRSLAPCGVRAGVPIPGDYTIHVSSVGPGTVFVESIPPLPE